jgi:porin
MRCPRVPLLVAVVVCRLVCGTSRAQEPAASAEPAPANSGPAPAAQAEKPSYGLAGGWGGTRDYLVEHGFTIDFSVTLEANRVLSGGLRQQTTAHALYDLSGSFDLDRIAGWKDAQVAFEAYVVGGHNPSQDVGDYQSFSNISADELAEIAQVYYEQWFAGRTCRLKLGKIDANSDFGAPANGTESIHSGSAYSPSTFTMVTYPNPATGILAGWVPNENWSLDVGMYDGAGMAGINTGSVGPATFFRDPPGYFFIGELGRRWKLGEKELVGGATLGAWRHTGTFDNVFGSTTHNTSGFYGTLDQELSRAAAGQSGGTKSVFLQLGLADEDVSPADNHLGLGCHWTGCCSARPDDALGVYISRVHFSDGAGFSASAETAYELSYRCQCCHGVALLPDLQFITNPGGDANIDDALVFSLRCELGF